MKKIYIFLLLIVLLTGCKPKEYTVTFNTDGGSVLDSVTIESGKTIEHVIHPQKDGYIFVTWSKDGVKYNDKEPINEDLNLTAVWTEAPDLSKEYKVIFSYPEEEKEVTVNGKEKVSKPKDPTMKYHKFVGWFLEDKIYNFDTPVTKDLFLVAKFEKKIVTVKFDLNGGSGITERQIDAGKQLLKPEDPTKFGYNFAGWYLLGKEYNFNSVIEKDITLVAKWEAVDYVTIRFNVNGGTEIKSQVLESGKKAKIPEDPVKEGYTFKYWEYNNEEFDFNKEITETIIVNAIYEKNEKTE